jgi:hypothetical protein
LNRRLGGLQSLSGRGGEEKYSQPLPGLEPPIIQAVAQRYTTELSRLRKENHMGKYSKTDSAIFYFILVSSFKMEM